MPRQIVTNVGSNKLLSDSIGPLCVLRRLGNAYTIELPRKMRTHPKFYVGRLRPYYQYGASFGEEIHCAQSSLIDTCARGVDSQPASKSRISSAREAEIYPDELPPARREENTVPAHSQAVQSQTLTCSSPALS